MTGITDRMDLGYFPLQDHAAGDDGVPVSVRQSLGGARITKFKDATATGAASESMLEYGRENSLGTLGDIHPWLFWQTRERSVRGSGAWAQVFGAMLLRADERYGVTGTQPIRDAEFNNDTRFRQKGLSWPEGFPQLAKGSLMIALPGTDEDHQHDLGFWADPRLIAPNASGPGECGTLVVDLQPDSTLCMGNNEKPGIGGRHARLQSLVRVIAMPDRQPNQLALNYGLSGADSLPGFGAIFAPVTGGGTTTPGGITPYTGSWRPGDTTRNVHGESRIGTGAFGAGLEGSGGDTGGDDEQTPRSFGAFSVKRASSQGIAYMAASRVYGPIHAGDENDKHQHGRDADGHPINSAHVSTNAYFFRSREHDGPMMFEGVYPDPPGWPLQARTHLTWDGNVAHPFAGDSRAGMWRWWTEVPFFAPNGEPGNPPTTTPPTGTPTPSGRTPAGPGGPHGPATPGPGNPTGGPGGTTTGTGKKKKKTTEREKKKEKDSTGGPTPPPGPPPPGTGGRGIGGLGPGVPRPAYRDPPPPRPPTVTPRGPWPGKRVPDHPPTAVGPTDPQGPGGGATGPTGPATPRNGICTEPANAGVVDPNDVHDPRNYRDNPTSAAIAGDGEIMPMSAGIYTGGPGAMGSAVTDPRIPLGRLSGLDPWTREPERVPGLVERIGGADRDSVGLYSILHPMQEGFAAMVFRPQLTVQGYPHFEHNPQVPPGMIERDEAVRPQVLAMRAWGSQSASTGDWSYVEPPMSSRARGGTGHGGILFSPPRFELEDYLGINTGANVEDVTGTRATQSYVLAAPGVAFALGKPTATGSLSAKAVTLYQDCSTATKALVITHDAVEVLRLSSALVSVTGALSASTQLSGDVVDAGTKFTSGGSDGINKTFSFPDNTGATHSVEITGGIITQWTVTP